MSTPIASPSAPLPNAVIGDVTSQELSYNSVIPAAPGSEFICDGREYCSQMKSRAEAQFFVRNCPNVKMDGDNDGQACEADSRF